ncbi:MAG: hypothetical protein LLG02_00160 [Pelosinus sp.]|nr:hypothetical protein [Pelosinus sp.]
MFSMSIKNVFHLNDETVKDLSAGENMICDADKYCRDAGAMHILNNLYSEGCAEKHDNLFRHPPF